MTRKSMLLVLCATLLGINAMAQTVQEATVQVGTLTVPAYTLSVEKDVKLVQNALNQRFKDAKLKKGILTVKVPAKSIIVLDLKS